MNTLLYFEQIVHVELDKQFSASGKLSQDFITSVLDGDRRHKRSSKQDLIIFTDDFKSNQEIQVGVRLHQSKLVSLLDKVFAYLPDTHHDDMTLPEEVDTVYLLKYLYNCLLSGLNYIERKFRHYIDKEMAIPAGEIVSLSKRAREELPLLIGSPRMQLIPVTLRDIITEPLVQLARATTTQQPVITWRKRMYVSRLTEQLKTFSCAEDILDAALLKMELHAFLQRINFNKPAYVNYLINVMEEEVEEQKNHRDKCTMIIMQQRKISKCITERTIAYDMCQMPLKEQLLEWLGYELDCFESMVRLDVMISTQTGQFLN